MMPTHSYAEGTEGGGGGAEAEEEVKLVGNTRVV